jgi:hypothetical protein
MGIRASLGPHAEFKDRPPSRSYRGLRGELSIVKFGTGTPRDGRAYRLERLYSPESAASIPSMQSCDAFDNLAVRVRLISMLAAAIFALFASTASGAITTTTDPGVIAAFQAGATVIDFESVTSKSATSISAYNDTDVVPVGSRVFNQIPGLQFSVGGNPLEGSNPALLALSGAIAGDAASAPTVLGPTQMGTTNSAGDGLTNFGGSPFMEVYLPVKVSKIGFWLNPSLNDVTITVSDLKPAFLPPGTSENQIEAGTAAAGTFVMITRPTAEIGGLFIGGGAQGFTIDDLTVGAGDATVVPEPGSMALLAGGLIVLSVRVRRSRR